MAYDVQSVTDYIRRSAAARGIDPETAVKVARSEGLASGVYQSNLAKGGRREPSYGPFQLLVGGEGTAYPAGMGNDFIAQTGLDPRDPSTVNAQVDFALDNAARNGWGAWYGAAKVGVGKRDGIGGDASPRGVDTTLAATGTGDEIAYGGAGSDDLSAPSASSAGLGGLGGWRGVVQSDEFGDTLQALGASLMGSPSNNPFEAFGTNMANGQALRLKRDAIEQERVDKENDRRALEMALMSRGMTADQARAYSSNAQAAGVAVDGIERQQKLELAQQERDRTAGFLSGITGAATDVADGDLPGTDMPATAPASGNVASSTNTGTLAQATRAADDAIAVTGSDARPEPLSSFNTGNKTVDALMGKRAQVSRMLVAAPSDDAFQRGKLALDQIDKQIDQYAPTASVKEYTYAMSQRIEAGEPIVKFEDWDREQKKAGATVVNTGSDSGAFYKTADEKRAGSFVTAADAGIAAQRQMVQVDQLEGILSGVETGGLARVKQAAGDYGINTEGLDDIQAATALISQMVPSQRAPGSGTMSDADLALFKQSLPRIINQPGGNETIIRTMRGIANYDMQVGDIADQVLNREITPAEGRKLMAQIENPLAVFKRRAGESKPQGRDAMLPSGVTEEDITYTMQKNGLTRQQVLERLR